MPELPDVEQFKTYIDATSLHNKIENVSILNDKILENVSEPQLQKALISKSFKKSYRHGKYLFLYTTGENILVLHFGMTGYPEYKRQAGEEHAHMRMRIDFDNGYYFGFINQRLLGRISITAHLKSYLQEQELGVDALKLDYETFLDILAKSRGNIKNALMNQNRVAGIGNIYSDEILFQSGIHPKTRSSDLSDQNKQTIFDNIAYVLKTSIKNNADIRKLPKQFIIPHRAEGDACPKCGTQIKKEKVSGRTAYYCPQCQT
jgi:formamidopyrimidine-DNA glycosylase